MVDTIDTREVWRKVWRSLRENGGKGRFLKAHRKAYMHERINERETIKTRLAASVEAGMIAIVHSGMDCDCSQFSYVDHVPVMSVISFQRNFDRVHQDAEGPTSYYFGKPSQYPISHESRDLALEAFENGHAHYVTMANGNEDWRYDAGYGVEIDEGA
jgi:hypothetical protein